MRAAVKGAVATVALTGLAAGGYGLYTMAHKDDNLKPVAPAAAHDASAMHTLPHAADLKAFEDFMAEYRKEYDTEEEKMAAFRTFVKNLRLIEAHNAKAGGMSKLAVNAFADVEPEVFKSNKLGLKNKPADERRKFYNNLGVFRASGVAVPDSIDWRTKGAVTPVKNQGQCGSCWSFSTTGALEGRNQVLTGDLCSISEQQFVDCDTENDHGCNGGLMDYAFAFAEKHNLCSEESFPYEGTDGKCPADLESTCKVCVPKGSVTGFQDVKSNDVDAMKEALSQGPVSVAIEADQAVFQFYKSGVVTSAECGNQLDHGVLAVGYGVDKDDATGEDIPYFLVKNSWGPSWGVDGYVKISAKLTSAGLSECGILTQPSFPVLKKVEFTQNPFKTVAAAQQGQEQLYI